MNLGRDMLLGVAIGDALGVPVEFKTRQYLKAKPIFDMQAYGTHNQPKGTWSDDSSLSFCLAESLATNGYDLKDISQNILDWFNKGLWTPHGKVFDIGGQTRNAIDELTAIFKRKTFHLLKNRHNSNEYSNGNGALMRILPIALETVDLPPKKKIAAIKDVAGLTHGHIRSTMACLIYVLFAEQLIEGKNKWEAYLETKQLCRHYFSRFQFPAEEQLYFTRILDFNIADLKESAIQSDGYVVHSLETCFWCLFQNDSYQSCVLAAINLGGDTDSNGAITGGLAGLIYQVESIPEDWMASLVKKEEIELLADRLFNRYYE